MAETGIGSKDIKEEMRDSYIDYAMSVLVGRAIPDVRDGLKPVHRRVLFSMKDLGLSNNKQFRKCARIVGDCLGKYHPHGDVSVYDTLIRMAQDFSLRYPLVDGQGNFGSIDGDGAAAMRYTEARMQKLSEELIKDIEKKTVDFIPNFDASLNEPVVLPSKFPNLLVNGSSGIAVGMATNIPPHNMGEVVDGVLAFLDDESLDSLSLMKFIKAPDFPTGAQIMGLDGVKNAYSTGKGSVRLRSVVEIDSKKKRLIVKEIPYQTNKSLLLEEIANLVRNKTIQGINNIKDESNRNGISVVIDLKRDANPEVVLNHLYNSSNLEKNFSISLIAVVDGSPKLLNLRELVVNFVSHRKNVIERKTQFEFDEALDKEHILIGLSTALDKIDEVIEIIKKSPDSSEAKKRLTSSYSLSEKQAEAILEMRLSRLASLEQQKIRDDLVKIKTLIKQLKGILQDKSKVIEIIKKELLEIKKNYGDSRRSSIESSSAAVFDEQDFIKSEEVVVTVTNKGYIKRLPVATYRQQGRGGRGVTSTSTKREDDFAEKIFIANTHSYLLCFTDRGVVHWLKVYKIPEASKQAMGKAIINLLDLSKNEKITSIIPVNKFEEEKFLLMATKKGTVKKTALNNFSKPRKGGIIAVSLVPKDSLVEVLISDGSNEVMLCSKKGSAVKCKESDIRPTGRSSKGVLGMNLRDDDEVISMLVLTGSSDKILTITEKGYGKKTKVEEYRLTSRGGKGVINIQTTQRNGNVVSVKSVKDDYDLICMSKKGIAIRVSCSGISTIGRNTQGVRIMKLGQDDEVSSVTVIPKMNDES